MSIVSRQAADLRALAEQLVSTAEQSRPTFTDESRPQFDHRIIQTTRTELRRLSAHVDDLDASLEHALRLLDD